MSFLRMTGAGVAAGAANIGSGRKANCAAIAIAARFGTLASNGAARTLRLCLRGGALCWLCGSCKLLVDNWGIRHLLGQRIYSQPHNMRGFRIIANRAEVGQQIFQLFDLKIRH